MQRRQFLTSSLALGIGLPTAATAEGQNPPPGAKAIAAGGPLTPPRDRPIQVAVAVSAGTTWIDFVGPQAVFQTFHYDPIEKKHKPRFQMFLVSEKLEPAGKLLPDYTFETAPPAQIVLVPA